MKKFIVLQSITTLEQTRWRVEANSMEEAIEKVKNSEVNDHNIDEQQSVVSDIAYEADQVDDFDNQ